MDLQVLDTFVIVNGKISFKEFHEARTFEALTYLGAETDSEKISSLYDKLQDQYAQAAADDVFRLTLDKNNLDSPQIEIRKRTPLATPVRLQVLSTREHMQPNRQYKWADRSYWNALLENLNAGYDDVLLVDSKNHVIETARCNVFFFEAAQDRVLTPPLEQGCLNGVFRRFHLAQGEIEIPELGPKKIKEEILSLDQIRSSNTLFIGNAVRGLMKAVVES